MLLKLICYDETVVKDNFVKLSTNTIYVPIHLNSITTQCISQMTHFFCLNGPMDPKMQNPGENTAYLSLKVAVIYERINKLKEKQT